MKPVATSSSNSGSGEGNASSDASVNDVLAEPEESLDTDDELKMHILGLHSAFGQLGPERLLLTLSSGYTCLSQSRLFLF